MSDTQLPDHKLVEIQQAITDHFKSLNTSGRAPNAPVTKEEALKALGFARSEAAEQWLCGADGNCGVKA